MMISAMKKINQVIGQSVEERADSMVNEGFNEKVKTAKM